MDAVGNHGGLMLTCLSSLVFFGVVSKKPLSNFKVTKIYFPLRVSALTFRSHPFYVNFCVWCEVCQGGGHFLFHLSQFYIDVVPLDFGGRNFLNDSASPPGIEGFFLLPSSNICKGQRIIFIPQSVFVFFCFLYSDLEPSLGQFLVGFAISGTRNIQFSASGVRVLLNIFINII